MRVAFQSRKMRASTFQSRSLRRKRAISALLLSLIAGNAQSLSPIAQAYVTTSSGTQNTFTFSYTNTVETFTIPSNVSEITITVTGAEGGRGGQDYSVRPIEEGYKGVVSGTISVTPGEIVSVAVGERGSDPVVTAGVSGPRSDDPGASAATGGNNPLGIYKGGGGGAPGPDGSSGYGGAGGAASVVKIGTLANDSATALIVAGGSGASGGNGQFAALRGGSPQANYSARTDLTSTNGQRGINTYTVCVAAPRPDGRCDGGGGSGGGGGAQGGARGEVPFGTGTNTEWYGLGSFPGQNSTSGFAGLSASYNYYTYSGVSNKRHGSVVISFSSGVPSAPSGVNGASNNSSVNLYWTRPLTAGVSEITGYQVEYAVSPYSSWTTSTTCSGVGETCTVTGLTNGTAYKFRVLARNAVGDGAYSALSQAITPSGPPSAPTLSSITPGDGSLSVAFTAGASTAPITDYQYSLDGTNFFSTGATSSPLTISGVANGTTYPVVIRAVNAAGPGSTSNSESATPSALPGAPTITNLVDGGSGTSLVVTFVAGYSGGSTISDYEYAVSVGLNSDNFDPYIAVGSTSSPFTISGLTSGTAYTVKLRAKNTAGYGPGSAFQNGVTLAAPNAPVISLLTSGDGRLVLSYTAFTASTNGGSAISKLEYSTNNGSNWSDAGTLSETFTILGLTNGVTYPVTIRATNAIGTSTASAATTGTPAAPPSSPQLVSVLAGQTAASVSWSAPASNGGAPVTGYTAHAYTVSTSGTPAASCTTATLTCSITGLTNGTTYFVAVLATNSAGAGAPTSPRISVIPAALPGAPTISGVTGGNAYLSVAFTAGTADVNAPITGYQYSIDNGGNWANASGTTTPLLISSLTNGTTYTVKIRATSSIGNGAASSGVVGTPYTVPSNVDPNTITYTAGNGTVTINWTAPAANGSAITTTNVTAFSAATAGSSSGTCTTSGATTSCTISSLSNGTSYYVSIETINGAGYSQRSTPRVFVKPGNASATTMTSSTDSIIVGGYETFTATVTTGATGTINFTSDGTSITGCSNVTIVSDTAQCVTASLSTGSRAIRANYSGDSTYASSASPNAIINVLGRYTVTYDNRGGTLATVSSEYISGSSGITLPLPTRTSYEFDGWYDAATNGTKLGMNSDTYTPTSTQTIYARWVQTSLWGMGASIKIGTITTVDGVGNGFSASRSGTGVQLDYLADSLPNATVLDVYLLSDTTRSQTYITNPSSFVVNLVLAWKAADDTVPQTAAGKPITMTITNPLIRTGAKIYALLGSTVRELGTATQNGQATVQITEDPEIVIASVVPDSATSVSASSLDSGALVSWIAPASTGGSDIIRYTATANTGQTCVTTTLSCTVTGLTNGLAYTFTVVATNSIGNGPSSGASLAATPAAVVVPAPTLVSVPATVSVPTPNVPIKEVVTPAIKVDTETNVVPLVTPNKLLTFEPKAPGVLPAPGSAISMVDGAESVISVTQNFAKNSIAIEVGEWKTELVAVKSDGTSNELEDLQLVITKGDRIKFAVEGLKPNSELSLYVFSTPIFLGKVTTDSLGNFVGSVDAPQELSVGGHTIQMGGYLKDGKVSSISLPILLKATAIKKTTKVYFGIGNSYLTSSQVDSLKEALKQVGKKKISQVQVVGFAQKTKYQIDDAALAKSRAVTVAKLLKGLGVKGKYLVLSAGYASERNEKARRAEVTISYLR